MAEELSRRALYRREEALGKEHLDTVTSINNIAPVLRFQGKYDAAEEMNRRSLEGMGKVLGEEHPDTLASLKNTSRSNYEEATNHYERDRMLVVRNCWNQPSDHSIMLEAMKASHTYDTTDTTIF